MADHPRVCSRCDTANSPDAAFCANCGKSLGGLMSALRGPESGDRWQFGVPALILAVFVTLIALVWVVAFRGGGVDDVDDAERLPPPGSIVDDPDDTDPDAGPVVPTSAPAPVPVPGSTSPVPLPATTQPAAPGSTGPAPPTTTPATAPPATTTPPPPTPPTTAAGAGSDAVPGDLAVPGRPMQAPACDDSFITVIASSIGSAATARSIEDLLNRYPRSNYLRTDQTCPSLRASVDGQPIYVVYLGPFPFAGDACAARAQGPGGAYARTLSTTAPPDHSVECEPETNGDGTADGGPDAWSGAGRGAGTAPDGSTPYVVPVADPARAGWASTHSGYPATDIFAGGCGATVVSPVEGRLLEVRRTDAHDDQVDNPATRGGRSVSLIGDDGVRYYFAHLDRVLAGLAVGGRVAVGDALGTIGDTGRASACHLHFGISPPCGGKEWKVRRGVVWPHPYLDAWADGDQRSPAGEVDAWLAEHPGACERAMADEYAADA